jgi:hypothetical protein
MATILQIIRPATPEDMAKAGNSRGATGGQFRPIAEQLAETTGWVVIFDGEPKAAAQIMANWNKAKKLLKTIEVCKVRGTGRVIARRIETNVTNVTNVTNITTINKSDTAGKSWTDLTDKQRTAAFREAWLQHGGLAPKVAIELGISNAEALAISKTLRSAGVIG